MKDHFKFNSEQIESLENKTISILDLFLFAKSYDISGRNLPFSFVNLLYYIDKKGDFRKPPFFKNKEICLLFFENLPDFEKESVIKYINKTL